MSISGRSLLGIEGLERSDVLEILDLAAEFRKHLSSGIGKIPTLQGKTIINFFFESSTRTRSSFEIAAKRLAADTINFSVAHSSASKGETLFDTARNIEAMEPDCLVIRHASAGAPFQLSNILRIPIINAGDGFHEHPTQALLDMATMRSQKKKIEGLEVLIVGDIAHSRVARSNIYLLAIMGAKVTVCGPPTLIPPEIEKLGVTLECNLRKALQGKDVVMMLRIQLERQNSMQFPSLKEYSKLYGLNSETIKCAKEGVMIMHPGPINRGVEMTQSVADGPYSVILEQVTHGVAVRMAVLHLVSRGLPVSEVL